MYLEDLEHLYRIGVEAAKSAGLRAVWIDVLCLEKDTAIFDSHRICDIARGSNRMVIAVEQKVSDRLGGAVLPKLPEGLDDLLQEWAARLWTLPEMLLAPAHHGFEIYAFVDTARLLTHIPKRNMAERAYGVDGRMVRELVDHMEGNLHLTQIELLTRGLDVVMKRPKSQYMNADAIYALMTLSRRRPKPDTNTSEFKAFSRLSLLNDSNLLLERLICILPRCRGTPWHDMQDYWGARLWDIYPMCQVAAVEDDDTVMLDGAFGASIEWGRLSRVGFLKRKTAWRTVADIFVRSAPGWLLIGIVTLATYAKPIDVYTGLGGVKKTTNPFIAVGIVFFLIGVATVAVLPYALLSLYRGKFWSTQAMFFGLEGTVTDLDWLEKQLFGFSEGRLKWSPYASTQTRHRIKTAGEHINDECEGEMPVELPLEVATGLSPMIEPDRLFTLVDTYNMNVITFRAVHPPSAALVCGHEGGMRRAILCSYEYSTQAFHREAVLRLSTKVLDRMDRVDRLRFSMKSKSEPRTGPAPA
ncbi:hypothetical protein GQ53DRAFT_670571 [Thozetella sp. PMI_491]|nr:hypothetical protein GQ53DRAFT_670571 [Thozetella sp. PMI_491]